MRYLSGGESHGPCLIGIIEGLPAGLELKAEDINRQLARRQQGYGRGGRMAIEKDRVVFLSGLRFNRTLGSPLALQIENRDWSNWSRVMAPEGHSAEAEPVTWPRPGHADLAGGIKYGHRDLRQVLERSSARETAMRVAVGAVARRLLEEFAVDIYSHVLSIGPVAADPGLGRGPGGREKAEDSPVRCADKAVEAEMIEAIEQARAAGDTLGGIFEVVASGLPPGLGSYVHWDRRLDGKLAAALASIQGIKGVEFGDGFASAARPGSECHDPIMFEAGRGIFRPTNRAGGLEGGMTNGEPLVVRAAMKPIPTLANPLPSVDLISGCPAPGAVERSDVCAVPAAAVVAEAVVAWELAVAFLDKFAADSMEELRSSYNQYRFRIREYLMHERNG